MSDIMKTAEKFQDEIDPLLSMKDNEDQSNGRMPSEAPPISDIHQVKVPFYRSTVEIVMVLYICTNVVLHLTITLYIYARITQQYQNGTEHDSQDACRSANLSEADVLLEQKIQRESSTTLMALSLSMTLPSIASALIIGALSDMFGRKIPMLLSVFGGTVRAFTALLVVRFELSLNYLFVAYVVDGFTGSFVGIMSAGFSYLADITDSKDQRAFRIAVAEALVAVGPAIMSVGAGFWIDSYGYIGPVVLAIGFLALNFMVITCLLKETFSRKMKDFQSKWTQTKGVLILFYRDTPDKRRWKIIAIVIAFLFSFSPNVAQQDIVTLFLLNIPLCWESVGIGIYNAIYMVVSWIVTITLVKILQRFGVTEVRSTFIGYFFSIIYFTLMVFASTNVWVFSLTIVASPISICIPMIRTVVSKLVKPTEIGSVFFILGAVQMFCLLAFNIMFNAIYQATLGITPGFVFSVVAGTQVIALIIMIVFDVHIKKETTRRSDSQYLST